MGYTFSIGNAVPDFDRDYFPELSARWVVEYASHENAPVFPGDEMTGNGNGRSPSYTVWSDFCRQTGLYGFFYDERDRLRACHPGCIGLTKEDADIVSACLKKYKKQATLPPGFEDGFTYDGPANFDYHLARLMWLDFWVRWAIENCETPAIQNT
jgi:hypothetical protein